MDEKEQQKQRAPEANHGLKAMFEPGRLLAGRYRVFSMIGQGGMGVVYRVEQVFLGKELALKSLDKSAMSESTVRRFEQEARATCALDHPNLVKVLDSGVLEDGRPYLAMELIHGQTLSQKLRETSRLSTQEALPIFIQACFGLSYAHQQGVVHRDLKPSNIMLVEGAAPGLEGSVKILDFGIARLLQHEGGEIQALTRTGEIFGSPLYMSPEQCGGQRVDHRADIYSLGCVFFETLTGTPPFVGETALATMIQHQQAAPPSLKEASLGTDFPAALEAVVRKMLEKDPAKRYQDLGLVAHDLQSVFKGTPLATTPLAAQSEKRAKQKTLPLAAVILLIALTAVMSGTAGYFAGRTKVSNSEPTADQIAIQRALPKQERPTFLFVRRGEDSNDPRRFQKALARSNRDGFFQWDGRDVSLEDLTQIANTPWIKSLHMDWALFENTRDVAVLAKLPKLDTMSLDNSNLDDQGLAELARCQKLNGLELAGTSITDQGVASLRKFKCLQYVKLSGCALVTHKGIQDVATMTFLDSLTMSRTPIFTNQCCSYFINSDLKTLTLEGTPLDDSCVPALAKMKKLHTLCLAGTRVTSKGVEQLARSSNLKELILADSDYISTKEIVELQQKFKNLKIKPWQ